MNRTRLQVARIIRRTWNGGNIMYPEHALFTELTKWGMPGARANEVTRRWWRRKAKKDGIVLQIW